MSVMLMLEVGSKELTDWALSRNDEERKGSEKQEKEVVPCEKFLSN